MIVFEPSRKYCVAHFCRSCSIRSTSLTSIWSFSNRLAGLHDAPRPWMGGELCGVSLTRGRYVLFDAFTAISSHEHASLSSPFTNHLSPFTSHQCHRLLPRLAMQEYLRVAANSGGVAERLIAPVLKTGRPKGLVSSNLTPSAPASRLPRFAGSARLREAGCPPKL